LSSITYVREYFDGGSKEEFEDWIRRIDAKYGRHNVESIRFVFYTNWFNIVSYAIHEYLLKSREKIAKEIKDWLDKEGFESSVDVFVEANGWNRRYKIDVYAVRKKVLYLGLPVFIRIIQILPRLLKAITGVLIAVLAVIGLTITIEFIRGFVNIAVEVVEEVREVAYQAGQAGGGLAILILLILALIILRGVRG
jgi:hypothetical protein